MFIVDDGCPDKSGLIAKKIIEEKFSNHNIEVLFLENAINTKLPIVNNIPSCSDSQKGGSINYGLCMASYENQNQEHIVIYTDADLSIHLGQIGLLIDEIINKNQTVAIGSRRDDLSILMKSSSRNLRGMFFIHLWKRLLPNIAYLNDTQCPLKAFRADIAQEIVHNNIESKFAFDIELLIKSELKEPKNISSIPIAMIDSEAESTTVALSPYLTMLKTIVKFYRKYLASNSDSEKVANFIENLSQDEWEELLNNIPTSNIGKSVDEFEYNFLD
jgi:glycosyltransferase involved in cell wall biosynthesis